MEKTEIKPPQDVPKEPRRSIASRRTIVGALLSFVLVSVAVWQHRVWFVGRPTYEYHSGGHGGKDKGNEIEKVHRKYNLTVGARWLAPGQYTSSMICIHEADISKRRRQMATDVCLQRPDPVSDV